LAGSTRPARLLCALTLPFFVLFEYARETLPGAQRFRFSDAFAAASFLPTTFGTLHVGKGLSIVSDCETLVAAL
jgi:hypothetical protein